MSDKIIVDQFSTFFMMPFTCKKSIALKQLAEKFKSSPHWERKKFNLEHGKNYNELQYFYPHMRDIIFDYQNYEKNQEIESVFHYEYSKINTAKSTFAVTSFGYHKELALKSIRLYIFPNKTSILVFEIENKTNELLSLEDCLRFNDLGRRIYPPFINPEKQIAVDSPLISEEDMTSEHESNAVSQKQYPQLVEINTGFKKFTANANSINLKDQCKKLAINTIISELLESDALKSSEYWPLIDDRMLTHTYYSISSTKNSLNKAFIEDFKKTCELQQVENSEHLELLYRMLYLDGNSLTCQNNNMLKEQLKESLYSRWSNYGTFYGFTRYSSIMISDYINAPHFLYDHFRTLYFRMALLLSFYRGSLLTFLERIEDLSINLSKGHHKISEELKKIHRDFLLFDNKYFYQEVSAQEQGIEMFNIWTKNMNIFRLLKEAKDGINGLYYYVEQEKEARRNKILAALSLFGTILIPVTIGLTILTIPTDVIKFLNIFQCSNDQLRFWGAICISSALLMFTLIVYIRKVTDKWTKN